MRVLFFASLSGNSPSEKPKHGRINEMEPDCVLPQFLDESEDEEVQEEEEDPPDLASQLHQFREKWQQEINSQNQNEKPHRGRKLSETEEQAQTLFLQGIQAEQDGALYEAIHFYKKAMQLVPDIETKIDFRPTRSPRERQESESSVSSLDSEDLDEDLFSRFQKIHVTEKSICYPNTEQRSTHISQLPMELLIYIFKWVVSTDLDMKSLESVSEVCRGFYLCTRDEEIWKLACLRIWGVNCGRSKSYGSWRNMFIERPHLHFNGCYISKTSYVRAGEPSLDNFYRPWHVVEYYRYVRFFPEGVMLMMTSPQDPLSVLPLLKLRQSKVQGMLSGYYRLSGNKVTGLLKRVKTVDSSIPYYRYKRHRQQQDNQNEGEQSFVMEFDVVNLGPRSHAKLIWTSYSIRTQYRLTGEENVADFELGNKSYPPLIFSRVKSYTAMSESPLQ